VCSHLVVHRLGEPAAAAAAVTARAAPSLDVLSGGRFDLGLAAAAERAGGDPGSIRRIINVQGVIGERPAPSRSGLPVGCAAGESLARARRLVGRDARRLR
jgi:hypothetical protein